ncbi:MAG: long-chain fatty acid--CoA ligase [Acidimicrobiia bacterium]|nr:long-chain fatty acid--CoA ligase [Acidimicrobiia bacterium]
MTAATNAPDLLREVALNHPDRQAYVHQDRQATYAWLDRAADGFASSLIELGTTKGSVVTLALPSSIKFAACYLGILRAGAIASAINLRLGALEQASIFGRTEPVVTVVGDGVDIPEAINPGQIVSVSDLGPLLQRSPLAASAFPALRSDDPACIVWTSGTTGEPKGAVYDHARMEAISRNIGQLTEPGDRRLVVLPFAHVGYMTRIWDELANGTTVVLAGEPWSAGETLRIIRDEQITMGTGVPTQWELVLAHPDLAETDFGALRVCGIGGASVSADLVYRMRNALGCPVLTRYTSTEAGVTTSTQVGDPDEVVATTVGRPAPEVELQIISPTDGTVLPAETTGEIVCRSPAMMRGYWHDDKKTDEVIDARGWLHTGDLGWIGGDGNLRVVGRLVEMYVRGGYNVYPAEVEAMLSEHPMVLQSAVIGVGDPILGQVGCAFVIPTDPASPPNLDELRDWCGDRIADYKAPDRLIVLDSLPLTAMHKIDKQALAILEKQQ